MSDYTLRIEAQKHRIAELKSAIDAAEGTEADTLTAAVGGIIDDLATTKASEAEARTEIAAAEAAADRLTEVIGA